MGRGYTGGNKERGWLDSTNALRITQKELIKMKRKFFAHKNMTIWAKLGLIILPTLLLIVMVEGGTRLLIWALYGSPTHGMHWVFEYEPYLLTKTNKGHRMHQDVPPKGETYRIVLIGGSTAQQIPEKLFEEAFKTISARDIEVINLAQGGYIINQERIMLLLYGIRYNPDLIITIDGINDIVTSLKIGRLGLPYSNAFIAFAVDHPILNGVFSILRKSQFINAINKLRERHDEKLLQNNSELRDKTIDHIEEGLQSIGVIAKGMTIPYIAVLQPYVHIRKNTLDIEKQLSSEFDYRKDFMNKTISKLNNRLRNISSQPGVYYVDATPVCDLSKLQCFRDEVHLTADGNKLLVAHIVNAAKKKGLAIK
jgi:hypothetical protein